tara:strand:+ start:248 stop:700 length:453 start_codon:yes stop_codon:yes gene_type:complete
MEKDQDKKQDGTIGHNSHTNNLFVEDAYYEDILQQAVRLLGRFNHYAMAAQYEISQAINGKNSTIRAVGARDADTWLRKLKKESQSWNTVLENMEEGKDVHVGENCKSEKLDIVSGSEYEFGQFIINKNSPKWCKENKDGKDYMEKVNAK